MSKENKIYSAVDAHEAEQFIGQEGYFGDILEGIHEKGIRGVLYNVLSADNRFRFDRKEGERWSLFQPIIKTDLEKAKDLLGKVMKHKNKDDYDIFTSACISAVDGEIRLDSIRHSYTLEGVLENFELVEDNV